MFELPTSAEGEAGDKHRIAGRVRGKRLFGSSVTHNELLGYLRDGWGTKTTRLTEEFGLEQYMETYQDSALILFAIDTSGRLRLVTEDEDWKPAAGWQVISLVKESNE